MIFDNCCYCLYGAHRNKAKYVGRVFQVEVISQLISGHVQYVYASRLARSSMYSRIHDLWILKRFGVQRKPRSLWVS